MKTQRELRVMERRIYYPTDTIEWYDPETGTWFDGYGHRLTDEEEYDPNVHSYLTEACA